jgi:O-acetylserine/cysteine efflux transporter
LHAPIIKLGVIEIGPLFLAFLRFSLTALFLLPFAGKISFEDIKKLLPVSLFFVCGNLMFAYLALNYIQSNTFVVLIMTGQFFLIFLAWLFYQEKFGLVTFLALCIGFAGIVIGFGAPDIAEAPIGGLFALLGAASWALGSIAMKRTGHLPPVKMIAYTYAMAVPIALVAMLLFDNNYVDKILNANPVNLGFVLFYQVGLMSAMTFVWASLIARNPAQYVSPFMMLQPIFGVIGAWFIFGERVSVEIMVGGILILLGIGIIHFRGLQKLWRQTGQAMRRSDI